MQIRKITEKDWDTMSSWWKDWGWEKIPAKDFYLTMVLEDY